MDAAPEVTEVAVEGVTAAAAAVTRPAADRPPS